MQNNIKKLSQCGYMKTLIAECKSGLKKAGFVTTLGLSLFGFSQQAYAATSYQIALKTGDGHQVQAQNNGGSTVNANPTQVGPWETFTLTDLNGGLLKSGDSVSIQAGSGHYFQEVFTQYYELNADANSLNSYSTFVIEKPVGGGEITPFDRIALKTYSGRYVRAFENGGNNVDTEALAVDCGGLYGCTWAVFEMSVFHASNVISFASEHSGKCLDVDMTDNDVRSMTCHGGLNQLWVHEADGTIRSQLDGNLCLDASASFGNLYVNTCHGAANQLWQINAANNSIVNQAYGECVDLYAYIEAEDADVVMYECNGQINQNWVDLNYQNFSHIY